jgi:hypothetical protein
MLGGHKDSFVEAVKVSVISGDACLYLSCSVFEVSDLLI